MTSVNVDGLGTPLVFAFFRSSIRVLSATSTKFVLDNTGFVPGPGRKLSVTGFGLTYGDAASNLLTGGTVTSLTMEQEGGYSQSWFGFSISAVALYNALKSGNETTFGNLVLGGNDTFDITSRLAPSDVNQVRVTGYDGDDTFNLDSSKFTSTNFAINGGNGNDTLNLTGGLTGKVDIFEFNISNESVSNLNISEIETVRLGAGFNYTVIPGGVAGKILTIDGTGLAATDRMMVGTSIVGGSITPSTLILLGGPGDDIFQGGVGDDIFNGGSGSDTVSYHSGRGSLYSTGVTVDLAITGPQTTAPNRGQDTFISIENLAGTRYDDVLKGDAYDNILYGFGGNDWLEGREGNDTLDGGGGDDRLDGGNGNDTASFKTYETGVNVSLAISGVQTVSSVVGHLNKVTLISIENLTGSRYADTLTGDGGNNILDGDGNVDTAVFSGPRSAYVISQASPGIFSVNGPDGNDTLKNIEFARFSDQTVRLLPGNGVLVDFTAPASGYMSAIRDFDGNDLGASAGWKSIGSAPMVKNGPTSQIFVNSILGRWAEVTTAADGKVYFGDHGWAGVTRVVGIYIDPLVQSGNVVAGSDHDSQRRFQNDLQIDNVAGILGAADYDRDGLQEVYFRLNDGTAYLHAYMHADGNIRYANYQTQQQVKDFLSSNGWSAATWNGWFPAGAAAPEALTAPDASASWQIGGSNGVLAALTG